MSKIRPEDYIYGIRSDKMLIGVICKYVQIYNAI